MSLTHDRCFAAILWKMDFTGNTPAQRNPVPVWFMVLRGGRVDDKERSILVR